MIVIILLLFHLNIVFGFDAQEIGVERNSDFVSVLILLTDSFASRLTIVPATFNGS